ncbi:hypothetical protein M0R19_03765 [Candidatus Pacearchaeota archaeon]|jgi:hypothetical protein|nr:hypothetical protein [Candidatus Pacearchaeota archaeon]
MILTGKMYAAEYPILFSLIKDVHLCICLEIDTDWFRKNLLNKNPACQFNKCEHCSIYNLGKKCLFLYNIQHKRFYWYYPKHFNCFEKYYYNSEDIKSNLSDLLLLPTVYIKEIK